MSLHPVKRWTLFETSVVMLSWVEGRTKVNRYSGKKFGTGRPNAQGQRGQLQAVRPL